ncbi:hypothetical protein OIU13_11700 [Brevundimonas sp. BT-123]|uniref:MerR family transcriptional regulator n=1 Tax=Brevundimonas sp. BT-123 TaxID=2986928 RepID=UPI002235D1A9|nr:MerR family transcriptional regulator [Brevundimonas sp. BT-123]MCW0047193.1 hypothetical protein [Brevundimonas sp. BT-123]
MPPKIEPSLRFSDVAFGIDITPKALRNWLSRDQVRLFSEEPESGWRRFTVADVAILALVRHIVPLGVQVETASRIAHTILEMMNGKDWARLTTDEEFPDLLGSGWSNSYVVLHPNGEDDEEATGWSLEIRPGWQRHNRAPAAVFVTIAPEPILRRAINRALTGDEFEPSPDTLYFNQRFADPEEIRREREQTIPEDALLTMSGAIMTDERKAAAENELAKMLALLAADKKASEE